MPSAATIRLQIETALAHRIPSALTPAQRVIRPVVPTGVAPVDELLDGGPPVGAITEMTGPECSGRTSLTFSFLARLTQVSSVCAWIDVSDTFHAESAAAAGIDLARLLWVRCGAVAAGQPASYQFALPAKYLIPAPAKQGLHGGGFGPHPALAKQSCHPDAQRKDPRLSFETSALAILRPGTRCEGPRIRSKWRHLSTYLDLRAR